MIHMLSFGILVLNHCDYIWGAYPDIRYGILGGRCGHDLGCGLLSAVWTDYAWQAGWAVGACDEFLWYQRNGGGLVAGPADYQLRGGLFLMHLYMVGSMHYSVGA